MMSVDVLLLGRHNRDIDVYPSILSSSMGGSEMNWKPCHSAQSFSLILSFTLQDFESCGSRFQICTEERLMEKEYSICWELGWWGRDGGGGRKKPWIPKYAVPHTVSISHTSPLHVWPHTSVSKTDETNKRKKRESEQRLEIRDQEPKWPHHQSGLISTGERHMLLMHAEISSLCAVSGQSLVTWWRRREPGI